MGGGYYEREVAVADSGAGAAAADAKAAAAAPAQAVYSSLAEKLFAQNKGLHPDLDPKGRTITCDSKNAVVVAIDVTGSMGDFTKVLFDKLPMFYGQIMLQGYMEDLSMSFAAVGDVNSDNAPIQVCDFAQGMALDDLIGKMYLEGGGGGQSYESYEVAAYYYARKVNFTGLAPGVKPFIFFTGDEGFYPKVLKDDIKKYFGDTVEVSVRTSDIFAELRQKYHVFFIHKNYFDSAIDQKHLNAWRDLIGGEHILQLDEPKAVVDVMLGAVAMVAGGRSLDRYNEEMKERGQSNQRVTLVDGALSGLAKSLTEKKVEVKDQKAAVIDAKEAEAKVEKLKQELAAIRKSLKEVPSNFLCPLTSDILVDPVFIEDGYTYERSAIEAWLKDNNTSPSTGEVLESKKVRPNHALKAAIEEFRQKHKALSSAVAAVSAAAAPAPPGGPAGAAVAKK